MIGARGGGFLAWGLALSLAPNAVLAAAEYQARVYIQPQAGMTDADPIQLVIEVQGTDRPEVAVSRLPRLTNLKVIGGPKTSSQFSWVNGRSTSTVNLVYTLLAEGPGAAEIPAFEIRVGSETFSTQPIRFEVGKSAAGPPPASPGGRERTSRRDQADVYLQASLGAEELWVGQPVTLSATLLTGTRVSGFDWREIPAFPKFWVEDDTVNPDAERYRTSVGGRRYTAYPLARKILVPSSPGEYTIDPFIAELQVRPSGDDFFDFFSIGRTQTVIRKSQPLKLRVRQLPQERKPEGFSGAVGSFKMNVDLDRSEAQVDDAVALKVTVEGDGFLKSVQPPVLDAPPDLKIFPPKLSDSLSTRGGRMVSKKTWEWVLVPLAVGELTLPEIRFSYFDPAQERYRVAASEPLLLAVKRGGGIREGPLASGGIRVERRDIAFIKPRWGRLSEGRARVHQKPYFLVLMVLPVVLVPVAIVAGRWHSRLRQDRGLARARKARGRARKRLRAARRRLEQLESGEFHEELARTLVEYVADRFNLSPAGLTYDKLDELMALRQVDPELRGRFRSCLESCDFARFVPASGRTERRKEVLDEAAVLIERVEKAL